MRFKNVFKIVFLLLLFFQTYSIATFNQIADPSLPIPPSKLMVNLIFRQVDFFTFAIIIAIFCLILSIKWLRNQNRTDLYMFSAILFYCAYQLLVIVPLSYINGLGSISALIEWVIPRMAVLLIPLFIWFVLPAYKKISSLFRWINLSSLILFATAIYNYLSGQIFTTSTGQMRLLWGGACLVFAMVFFINFFRTNRKPENYFFIISSLIGLIFVNHRTAYLAIFLVTVIGVWSFGQVRSKLKMMVAAFLIIILALGIFAQNQLIWKSFSGRIESISLQDDNVESRILGWHLAYEHFLDSPINGSLLSNEYYRPIHSNQIQPHGFIFEILPTQGLVGLSFYLFLLIYTLWIAFKNRADEVTLQMMLVLMFYIIFSSFNVTLLNTWNMLIMILAISVILYKNQHLNQDTKSVTE